MLDPTKDCDFLGDDHISLEIPFNSNRIAIPQVTRERPAAVEPSYFGGSIRDDRVSIAMQPNRNDFVTNIIPDRFAIFSDLANLSLESNWIRAIPRTIVCHRGRRSSGQREEHTNR
jgi:hypothetical protein